MVRLSTAPDHT